MPGALTCLIVFIRVSYNEALSCCAHHVVFGFAEPQASVCVFKRAVGRQRKNRIEHEIWHRDAGVGIEHATSKRAGRRAGHLPSLEVTPEDLAPPRAQAIKTKISPSNAPARYRGCAEREGEREGESRRVRERRTEGQTEVRRVGDSERERECVCVCERRSERRGRDVLAGVARSESKKRDTRSAR